MISETFLLKLKKLKCVDMTKVVFHLMLKVEDVKTVGEMELKKLKCIF